MASLTIFFLVVCIGIIGRCGRTVLLVGLQPLFPLDPLLPPLQLLLSDHALVHRVLVLLLTVAAQPVVELVRVVDALPPEVGGIILI